MDAYNLALHKSKKESRYLIIVDEFLYSVDHNMDILSFINNLFSSNSKIGGVVVNWIIFGSSHYLHAPGDLVTSSFLYRSKDTFEKNRLVKTICDPRKVAGIINPHYAIYRKGYYAVDLNGKRVDGAETQSPLVSELRLNHYFTKSKEEFIKKRARGMADKTSIRNISDFTIHDRNDIYDKGMLYFKKKIKNKIKDINNEK